MSLAFLSLLFLDATCRGTLSFARTSRRAASARQVTLHHKTITGCHAFWGTHATRCDRSFVMPHIHGDDAGSYRLLMWAREGPLQWKGHPGVNA